MYGLRPIYDFVDLSYTKQVKQIKDTLYVVYNRAREKFIVKDVDLHGEHYIVMIVQEPDGGFRPFDERAMETLRKSVYRGPDVKKILGELEQIQQEKQRLLEKDSEEMIYGLAETLKWVGVDVTPSTAWRDRSLPHEAKVRREQLRAFSR